MKGPKGISDLIVFCFFNNEGATKNKPRIEERKRINGTDCHPNSKPTPAINLASPSPMPSIFFKVLYKKIINQILKYPMIPPMRDWLIS